MNLSRSLSVFGLVGFLLALAACAPARAQNVAVQADATTGVLWRPSAFLTGNAITTATNTQTLTNKTISGASNTLTNIGNSSLTNSAITIAGTSTSLGGSITLDTIDNGLASTGLIARTAANTRAARTLTGTTGQITVTNGDGVSGNPTISLPSTITQATTFSSDLTTRGSLYVARASDPSNQYFEFSQTSGGGEIKQSAASVKDFVINNAGAANLIFKTGGITALTLSSTQNAALVGNLTVSGTGNQAIGGVGSRLVLQGGTGDTPASASATGTAGSVVWDGSYIYVCTATNTWKRAAIATW